MLILVAATATAMNSMNLKQERNLVGNEDPSRALENAVISMNRDKFRQTLLDNQAVQFSGGRSLLHLMCEENFAKGYDTTLALLLGNFRSWLKPVIFSDYFTITEQLNDAEETALYVCIKNKKFEVARNLIYKCDAKVDKSWIGKLIEENNVRGMWDAASEIQRQIRKEMRENGEPMTEQTALYQILYPYWEQYQGSMSREMKIPLKFFDVAETFETPPTNRDREMGTNFSPEKLNFDDFEE
jgi:hypothetical protein